ncbi:MAG: response regulator [Myxococcota bacterium]|nr:response regulator [Myxococcota bacterium]
MDAKVLLVDRTQTYRNSVAAILAHAGIDTVEAETGATAIAVMRQTPCDIVVIDNNLQDTPGVDILDTITQENKKARIVFIVEPAFRAASDEVFCHEHNIARLIRGPVHPSILAEFIEDLVTQKSAQTPSIKAPVNTAEVPTRNEPREERVNVHVMAVRRSYQQKLPQELKNLEQALTRARTDPTDQSSVKEAHRIAHAMHGTSGTLGLQDISQATGQIEVALKRIMDGAPPDTAWNNIFRALKLAQTSPDRSSKVEATSWLSPLATILLVDSDRDTMADVEAVARKNLINIVTAENSEQAVALARKKKIDGAIIDIQVNGQDKAFELVQQIRSEEGLHHLPIAMMSVDSSVLNRVAATHAGASQFLQKPLNEDELVETVRDFSASQTDARSKILIVDDDEHFRAHVATLLEGNGMDVASLGEPEHILETMDLIKPDILLLDVVMPKISGFDVCRLLRSTAAWKNTPILFLTGESDPTVRLECFQAGGDDYIEKPVIKEELLARIGVRQERIRLFKERADRDSLTNLPNRRAFLEMFKIRVADSKRYGRPLTLCLMDLDKFKQINDTYGHLAGDRVLIGFGKLLSSRFRTVDIRGRWGGEEFAVVFYGEESRTSKLILSRVLEEFKHLSFEGDHGERFSVTFSCGIATFPQDGTTFDELFRTADEKLYLAKESGRSRIEI